MTLIPVKRAPIAKLTAAHIAAILARQIFEGDLMCPNCTFTGPEVDLLVVHRSLRLIDVEIKLTRADLKADVKKAKWWHQQYADWYKPKGPPIQLGWPRRIWKHYYVMPIDVWKPELVDSIPANSGVLVISEEGGWGVRHIKRAKCNRDAEPIEARDAVNIARLASLRYWAVLTGGDDRWARAG